MKTSQFDIFDSADDNALEAIEKRTKLSAGEKDRLFEASMEKLEKMKAAQSCDIETTPEKENLSQSGEKIRLRRYIPVISAAACLIAVIGISGMLISLNNRDNKPKTDKPVSSAVVSLPTAENSSDTSPSKEKPSASVSEADTNTSETDSSANSSISQPDEPTQIHLPDSQVEVTQNDGDQQGNNDDPQPTVDVTEPSQDDQKTVEHRADGDNTDYDRLVEYERWTIIFKYYYDVLDLYFAKANIPHDDTRMWFDDSGKLVPMEASEDDPSSFDCGYYLVTDTDYKSTEDIKQLIGKVTTGSCQQEWTKTLLGSSAGNGGKPLYADIDGSLYVGIAPIGGTSYIWTDDTPLISDMTDSSFTVKVPYQAYPNSDIYYLKMYVIKGSDDTWRISRTEKQ